MTTYDKEQQLVSQKRGKWSDPGIPHKGWDCVEIEDLGEPSQLCEMCESQNIRYVHHMEHPDYPDTLGVGCVCSGHMEGDLVAAKQRDSQMHSRAHKRKRWLSRAWKISLKGNDYIKSDGYIITVYRKKSGWGATIAQDGCDFVKHSRLHYSEKNKAKLAAFDVVTKLLSKQKA